MYIVITMFGYNIFGKGYEVNKYFYVFEYVNVIKAL